MIPDEHPWHPATSDAMVGRAIYGDLLQWSPIVIEMFTADRPS